MVMETDEIMQVYIHYVHKEPHSFSQFYKNDKLEYSKKIIIVIKCYVIVMVPCR